jgi:hypothetical protein
MSQQQDQQGKDHHSELLRVFKIEHRDLEANRSGALGPQQRRRLVRSGHPRR